MLLLMPSGLSLFFGNTFQNSSTRTQVLTISCRQQLTLLRAYPGMPYRPLYSLCILNAPSCLHISATLALLFPMEKVQRPGRNQHHQATCHCALNSCWVPPTATSSIQNLKRREHALPPFPSPPLPSFPFSSPPHGACEFPEVRKGHEFLSNT